MDTGHAALESDDHLIGGVPVDRRVFGVGVDVLGRRIPEMFQEAGFPPRGPHTFWSIENGERFGDVDRDGVLFGEGDSLLPRPRVSREPAPVPPDPVPARRIRLRIGLGRYLCRYSRARRCSRRVSRARGDQMLDDQRPADRRHQRVSGPYTDRWTRWWADSSRRRTRRERRRRPASNRTAVQRPLAHHLHVLAALA